MEKNYIAIKFNREPFAYLTYMSFDMLHGLVMTTTPNINTAATFDNEKNAKRIQRILNAYYDDERFITMRGTKEFLEEIEKLFEESK